MKRNAFAGPYACTPHTQLLERVPRMGAAPQRALMADAALARPAVHAQLLVVHRALVVLGGGTAGRLAGQAAGLDVGADLLQALHLHGDLLQPPAVDQLVDVQRGPAVRTLAPLLGQPARDAKEAAQLRAVRTEVRLLQLLHADEAAEHIVQVLAGGRRFTYTKNGIECIGSYGHH